jgi:hypothetical protein
MSMHEGNTASKDNSHRKKGPPRAIFKGNETWPRNSAASHKSWTLDFHKYEALGVVVFKVHTHGTGRTSLEEVLCAWTRGVTLSPPEGIYRAFYLGTEIKPTAAEVKTYIENLFEEEGAPSPIVVRPPKIDDDGTGVDP